MLRTVATVVLLNGALSASQFVLLHPPMSHEQGNRACSALGYRLAHLSDDSLAAAADVLKYFGDDSGWIGAWDGKQSPFAVLTLHGQYKRGETDNLVAVSRFDTMTEGETHVPICEIVASTAMKRVKGEKTKEPKSVPVRRIKAYADIHQKKMAKQQGRRIPRDVDEASEKLGSPKQKKQSGKQARTLSPTVKRSTRIPRRSILAIHDSSSNSSPDPSLDLLSLSSAYSGDFLQAETQDLANSVIDRAEKFVQQAHQPGKKFFIRVPLITTHAQKFTTVQQGQKGSGKKTGITNKGAVMEGKHKKKTNRRNKRKQKSSSSSSSSSTSSEKKQSHRKRHNRKPCCQVVEGRRTNQGKGRKLDLEAIDRLIQEFSDLYPDNPSSSAASRMADLSPSRKGGKLIVLRRIKASPEVPVKTRPAIRQLLSSSDDANPIVLPPVEPRRRQTLPTVVRTRDEAALDTEIPVESTPPNGNFNVESTQDQPDQQAQPEENVLRPPHRPLKLDLNEIQATHYAKKKARHQRRQRRRNDRARSKRNRRGPSPGASPVASPRPLTSSTTPVTNASSPFTNEQQVQTD